VTYLTCRAQPLACHRQPCDLLLPLLLFHTTQVRSTCSVQLHFNDQDGKPLAGMPDDRSYEEVYHITFEGEQPHISLPGLIGAGMAAGAGWRGSAHTQCSGMRMQDGTVAACNASCSIHVFQ
jgi:hypothetical protein